MPIQLFNLCDRLRHYELHAALVYVVTIAIHFAVADSLSFYHAADACHVSQPSLSAQIAELKRAVKIRIFERNRRSVALTAAGRDFIESARAVMHNAELLTETARHCTDPFAGTLRIGAIPTISPYLLPYLTPALH